MKLIYLISQVFWAWTFLNFLAHWEKDHNLTFLGRTYLDSNKTANFSGTNKPALLMMDWLPETLAYYLKIEHSILHFYKELEDQHFISKLFRKKLHIRSPI